MTYEPVSNIYDEGSISIKQAASLSISDDYAYVQLVCVCVCVRVFTIGAINRGP